jgi:DNA-binding transcriptional MerR regulator
MVTGVTRKTLFYYDRIGLLEPSRRSGKQNFKEYDEQAVNRLLEIRLYREMGLSIPVIQGILEGDENARKQFLEQISMEIHSDIRKRIADARSSTV